MTGKIDENHVEPTPHFLKPDGTPYRVAIGLPSDDFLYTDMGLSLVGIVAHGGVVFSLLNQRGCYVHENRRHIAEVAIEHAVDYLFFMDTDIVAPPNTVLRLLSHKRPVVGATYVKRKHPHTLLGSTISGDLNLPMTGLHEMAELPTGCMLIDMKVFDQIRDDGPLFRTPVINGKTKGEDIDFSHRCLAAGVKMFVDVDLSLQVAHLGVKKFTILETMMAQQQQQAPRGTAPTPISEMPIPKVA